MLTDERAASLGREPLVQVIHQSQAFSCCVGVGEHRINAGHPLFDRGLIVVGGVFVDRDSKNSPRTCGEIPINARGPGPLVDEFGDPSSLTTVAEHPEPFSDVDQHIRDLLVDVEIAGANKRHDRTSASDVGPRIHRRCQPLDTIEHSQSGQPAI